MAKAKKTSKKDSKKDSKKLPPWLSAKKKK